MPTLSSPSKLAVIFSGEEIDVMMLDGTALHVCVRAMPVRHLAQVLDLCTDEAGLIELVCYLPSVSSEPQEIVDRERVPSGWADNLTDVSHDRLFEAASRLNFSRAATWVERQVVAQQARAGLMKRQMEMIAPLAQEMVRSLVSSLPDAALSEKPVTKS